MIKVLQRQYWNKIVDYYYEHVHWDSDPAPSLYEWIEKEYQGSTSLGAKYIYFDDEARANWFVMRWQ